MSAPSETTVEERLGEVHARLVEAIEAITSGQEWAAMLAAAAKLHSYSPNNVFLIASQCPEATTVAGYNTWRALGRHVRRGERGISILAPVVRRAAESEDNAEEAPGEARRVLRGFRVAHVFDISQTDGEALPEVAPCLLGGSGPDGLYPALAAQVEAAGYQLVRAPLSPANGQTDYLARTVTVADRLEDAQATKTLAHELAHVLLHNPHAEFERARAEVEAESVAFIVCARAGLASEDYSFPYVARWSGGDPDAVRHTAERVIGAARDILVTAGLAPAPVDPATQQVLARPAPGRVRAPTTGPPNPNARRHRNLAR